MCQLLFLSVFARKIKVCPRCPQKISIIRPALVLCESFYRIFTSIHLLDDRSLLNQCFNLFQVVQKPRNHSPLHPTSFWSIFINCAKIPLYLEALSLIKFQAKVGYKNTKWLFKIRGRLRLAAFGAVHVNQISSVR